MHNRFGFFQTNAQDSFSTYSVGGSPGLFSSHQPSFNLGVNLQLNQPSFVSSSTPSFVSALDVDTRPPSVGLVSGTAKSFLKDELNQLPAPLPNFLKTSAMVLSTASIGKQLSHNIQRALEEGQSKPEAITCQTVKTITEEISGKFMKNAIVAGIPTYLAATAELPPLALTIPVVLPQIPNAYAGAQVASQVLGNIAEIGCHEAFDFAKQLSSGRNP